MLSLTLLRSRWSSLRGTFVALCLGAAILSTTALTVTSAGPRVPVRYAAADVLVLSPAVPRNEGDFSADRPWSPEAATALVRALAALPGVATAVPDRSFYAQPIIGGRPVDVSEGQPWAAAALSPYRLVAGRPPALDGEVVLDRALGLVPGSPVTLLTARGPAPYTVSGLVDGPGLYAGEAVAERLGGGVRVIGLRTGPGAGLAAIRDVVGGRGRVLTGPGRAEAESTDDERTRWIGTQVLGAVAALGGFVSVFVVASTFAFSVAQRRRELALLRTVGATPRQIRRLMYGEALAVGAAASAAGALLGMVLAPALGGVLVTAGFEPPSFEVRVTAWPVAAAFAAGLVVALLGVWSASWRAGRVRPLEALREVAVDTRPMTLPRWISGGVFVTGGLALAAGTGSAREDELVNGALFSAMALVVGLTLLAPAITPPLVRAISWPLSRSRGAVGMLARQSALTAVRRTASTAAPVLLTVCFITLITGMVQTTAAAFAAGRAASAPAGAVLVPDGTPGLSDAAVFAAGGTAPLPTILYGQAGAAISALGSDTMADGTMAVADWLAREHGWRQGATAPVTFQDGRTSPVRVVAVLTDAPAPVLLARDMVRAHDPSALASEAYVRGTHPLPPDLGARIIDVAAYSAAADAEEDRLVWLFTLVLVAVSAGYTAVSIVNTLMMAAAARSGDFAVLRLSGATRRQALGAAAAEAALVVGIGTVLGLAVAFPALLGMWAGLAEKAGTAVPLVVPWPVISLVVAACLLLAVGASICSPGAGGRATGRPGSPRRKAPLISPGRDGYAN